MTVTALFPVSPPTVDGSHDFLLFLMLCQNFLGDLFLKASAMASALHFCWVFRQALNAYLNSFLLSFMISNRGPLFGLWLSIQYKYACRAALCFSLTSLFHPGTLCFCFRLFFLASKRLGWQILSIGLLTSSLSLFGYGNGDIEL